MKTCPIAQSSSRLFYYTCQQTFIIIKVVLFLFLIYFLVMFVMFCEIAFNAGALEMQFSLLHLLEYESVVWVCPAP